MNVTSFLGPILLRTAMESWAGPRKERLCE